MPNLADLIRQCEALGLAVEIPRRPAKAPYERALREHFLREKYPSGLPYRELSPMLLCNFHDLHEREQDALFESDNWIAQQKFNGCRLILHFVKNVGVFCHGRRETVSTFRREDYSSYLPFREFKPGFQATIDTEATLVTGTSHEVAALLHTSPEKALRVQQQTPMTFHAFDIVSWQDEDLRRKKLAERLGYLDEFKSAIEGAEPQRFFDFPQPTIRDKKKFYDTVTGSGGEGVVFKNLSSTYHADSSRDRRGWVKLKPQIELDAYVSGFEPGKPSSKWHTKVAVLEFAVKLEQGPRVVAKVSSLPYAFRKEISAYDRSTGEVRLRAELYGLVAHVKGYEVTKNALRLAHASIEYWRKDQKPESCRYRFEDLRRARWGGVNGIPKALEGGSVETIR